MTNFSASRNTYSTPKTLRDARRASKKNSTDYRESMKEAIQRVKCSITMKKKLEALLGWRPYSGKLLGSDMEAKDELRRQLISHVSAHEKQNPTQRFFHLIMLSDEFRVSKKEPHLWLKRLRSKSDKVVRMLCKELGLLGGIGMIEGSFVLNSPDTREAGYAFHTHVLVWADADFDEAQAKQALKALPNWRSSLGLDPIRLKEITAARGVAAYLAYYMAKNPVDATNIIEKADGSFKVRKTTKGYRTDAKLRLLEGLSQCYLQDMLFGVADGKFLRDPVIRCTKEARKLAHRDLKSVDVTRRDRWFYKLWKASKADHSITWKTYV